jgi:hypothetical protein
MYQASLLPPFSAAREAEAADAADARRQKDGYGGGGGRRGRGGMEAYAAEATEGRKERMRRMRRVRRWTEGGLGGERSSLPNRLHPRRLHQHEGAGAVYIGCETIKETLFRKTNTL